MLAEGLDLWATNNEHLPEGLRSAMSKPRTRGDQSVLAPRCLFPKVNLTRLTLVRKSRRSLVIRRAQWKCPKQRCHVVNPTQPSSLFQLLNP